MARTIAEIQAQMDAEQALQSGLSGLNSPSQAAIYTLWKYIISACIYYHEVLMDLLKSDIETIVNDAPIGTDKWLKAKSLEFQYSATDPQILVVNDNYTIEYATVDTTLQIITRCSVKTLANQVVSVKVAKSDPPIALSAAELSSFDGYLDKICFAGVQYNAVSLTSDKLFIEADVYYDGQYAAVIQANVIDALNAYLADLPFDGYIRVSAVEDAIQAVAGVKDIVINNMAIRADGVAFGSGTSLVTSNAVVYNKYPTVAGYAVEETTAGETFTDKLTFLPE